LEWSSSPYPYNPTIVPHTKYDSLRRLAWVTSVGTLVGVWTMAALTQAPAFRSGVRLVEINAIVHDRSGRPISDLAATDFRIFEDGKEQRIELFSLHDARPSASEKAVPSLPPGVYSNRAAAQGVGSVTAILFDRLNSTFEDQKAARDQMLKALAATPPGDRVALYVLESDAVTVLHDFTADSGRLVAAINRAVRATSVEVSHSDEPMPTVARSGIDELDADTEEWLQRTHAAVAETFLVRRAELTLNGLESIASHLAGIAGRKNLIWISASFPFVIPVSHGAPVIMNRATARVARAINQANIAVYPVDIRGLIGAITNTATITATVERNPRAPAVPTGAGFTNLGTVSPNQDTMREVADATGGKVFVNGNAIGDAIRKAVDDSRVSYVLGYYSSRNDNKFHDLDVKVARPGVDVRHRKGYLALAPEDSNSKTRLAALDRAMMSAVPATGIELMAGFDRTADGGTLTVKLSPELLTWQQNKDVREGAIDIVIAQSTPEGKYFKVKETTAHLSASPEQYKQMLDGGFTFTSTITLQPHVYRLHVIVSDVASQSVGSLIIPIK
jgi:VWFA-related protein